MVESLQLDPKKWDRGGDDFESMLTMDTTEQQLQNTKTYHKLIEKSNTTGISGDKLFEDDKEVLFPT
jgi:hypothetical protein